MHTKSSNTSYNLCLSSLCTHCPTISQRFCRTQCEDHVCSVCVSECKWVWWLRKALVQGREPTRRFRVRFRLAWPIFPTVFLAVFTEKKGNAASFQLSVRVRQKKTGTHVDQKAENHCPIPKFLSFQEQELKSPLTFGTKTRSNPMWTRKARPMFVSPRFLATISCRLFDIHFHLQNSHDRAQ